MKLFGIGTDIVKISKSKNLLIRENFYLGYLMKKKLLNVKN